MPRALGRAVPRQGMARRLQLAADARRKELQMGILDNLLGDGQLQKQYNDFVKRYEQGNPSEGYSDEEVLERYGEVSHAVPPDQL